MPKGAAFFITYEGDLDSVEPGPGRLTMSQPVEEQVLREVEAFPFTNLTRLYRHAGKVLPEALGGGCLWMAARLARLLRTRLPGIAVTHHDLGTPGSHLATVSNDGREMLLYEPSLFQVCPFSLTRFAADPACCTSDVFPPLETPMRLRFSRPSPSLLRMELLSPRGNVQRVFPYVIEHPAAINEEDPYVGLPFPEPQDQLYLHVLNEDFSKSVLIVNTRTRRITVGRVREQLYVDSEPGFNSRFERVAGRLHLTDRELRDLLGGALEIHRGYYPDL
jgi:hypothetical protein